MNECNSLSFASMLGAFPQPNAAVTKVWDSGKVLVVEVRISENSAAVALSRDNAKIAAERKNAAFVAALSAAMAAIEGQHQRKKGSPTLLSVQSVGADVSLSTSGSR